MDEFGSSEAGKKGGKARASKLSPEKRSEIARAGGRARWNRDRKEGELPTAVCGGETPLRIGNVEIPCYVLDDERRVITLTGLQSALGLSPSGGTPRMTAFAQAIADNPSMAKELALRLESPIAFTLPKGGVANGYEATLLADLCDAILEARKKNRITARYEDVAKAAELVVRGFAVVGIIALIDEATGYQAVRQRFALAELLDRYLDDHLNLWTKTFSDEYYLHLFRLLGWDSSRLKPGDPKPAEIGRITRDVVYRRLHPGIVQELEQMNPEIVPGRRLFKHHQWLTREIGHPALKEHLARIETVMSLSDDWLDFENKLQKALPRKWDTPFFGFISDDPPQLPPPPRKPPEATS